MKREIFKPEIKEKIIKKTSEEKIYVEDDKDISNRYLKLMQLMKVDMSQGADRSDDSTNILNGVIEDELYEASNTDSQDNALTEEQVKEIILTEFNIFSNEVQCWRQMKYWSQTSYLSSENYYKISSLIMNFYPDCNFIFSCYSIFIQSIGYMIDKISPMINRKVIANYFLGWVHKFSKGTLKLKQLSDKGIMLLFVKLSVVLMDKIDQGVFIKFWFLLEAHMVKVAIELLLMNLETDYVTIITKTLRILSKDKHYPRKTLLEIIETIQYTEHKLSRQSLTH